MFFSKKAICSGDGAAGGAAIARSAMPNASAATARIVHAFRMVDRRS